MAGFRASPYNSATYTAPGALEQWVQAFRLHYTSGSEKAMATHSSTLAWQIPWMEEPCGLQSMGSLGVGHD